MCDATANAQRIAERWREARSKRAQALIAIEGLQRFLITVETLNKERRPLRSIYLAQKPGTNGPAHRLAINGWAHSAPAS